MLVHNEIKNIEKNWGYFLQFTENQSTTVKLLHMKKGLGTSYQYHNHRSEQWHVISGKVLATKGVYRTVLEAGQTILIEKIQRHKLEALEDSIVLEISKGFFSEDDIIRL